MQICQKQVENSAKSQDYITGGLFKSQAQMSTLASQIRICLADIFGADLFQSFREISPQSEKNSIFIAPKKSRRRREFYG